MLDQFHPDGVCAREIRIARDDHHVVRKLEAFGGCSGNLPGIAAFVEGMTEKKIIPGLHGIPCNLKKTSCPDQLAIALEQLLRSQQQSDHQTGKKCKEGEKNDAQTL